MVTDLQDSCLIQNAIKAVLGGLKKIVIVERTGGVSRSGAGAEGGLARVNSLITGSLDLKIHNMEDNF